MADEPASHSRRRAPGDASRRNALSELAALRSGKEGGNAPRRIDNFKLKLEEDVYDLVGEDDYAKLVVQRRMEAGDFVVGDDALGYGDIGEDDWDIEGDVTLESAKPKTGASSSRNKRKSTNQRSASLSAAASLMKGSKVTSMFTSSSKFLSSSKQSKQNADPAFDSILDNLVAEVTVDDDDRERLRKRRKGSGVPKHSTFAIPAKPPNQFKVISADHSSQENRISKEENHISNKTIVHEEQSQKLDTENKAVENNLVTASNINLDKHDSGSSENSNGDAKGNNSFSNIKKNDETTVNKLGNSTITEKIPPSNSVSSLNLNNNGFSTKKHDVGNTGTASTGWKGVSLNESDSKPNTDLLNKVSNESFGFSEISLTLNEEGRLLFYFLDAYEDTLGASPGTVYLFGKVYSQDQYMSCCIVVKNIKRSMYAISQENIFRDNDLNELEEEAKKARDLASKSKEPLNETKNQVAQAALARKISELSADIKEEITEILLDKNVNFFTIYPVKRSYAFERADIPKREQYCLKIKYPYDYPPLPIDLKGKTFTSLLGTNTSALEHVLIKRKIMGPCWLSISNPKQVPFTSRLSHCKLEATIDNPKDIKVHFSENNLQPPPLTVASLHLKTAINQSQGQNLNEIVAMTIMYCKNVKVDRPMSDLEWNSVDELKHFSIIRKLDGGYFPPNFDKEVALINEKAGSNVLSMKGSERELLSLLLAKILYIDPDVLIGHSISAFDLELLLNRMKIRKVGNWSSLGRLKRNHMPTNLFQKSDFGPNFNVLNCISGRLICDTSISSRELLKETSYSLTNLAQNQLGIMRKEISTLEIIDSYRTVSELIQLVQLTENDAWLQLKLFFHLNILPLSRQLTNISGNLWNKTLQGSRAQRIEYLLLHEFHSRKFILPDKLSNKEKEKINAVSNANKSSKKNSTKTPNQADSTIEIEDEEEEVEDDVNFTDNGNAKSNNRKRQPAYSGGLVLEPKKGFYDKIVLLLDFNSLYPSIIQEFNICFTTVERSNEGSFPSLPEGRELGILPQILKTLVQRRRQVKEMLKKETNPTEKKQLDIRQQALKLTANSMYGCLGFSNSRFYAKPIAELITSQGREILQRTVNLVENSLNLEVIYGDTDSIMIHTGIDNIEETKEIGIKVKKEVNKHYKLLEIEVDAIYLRMLLIKKKKYAAIKLESMPDGTWKEIIEKKGIDIVRRDWSVISKDIGNYCLNQIFSKCNRESVVESIHEYLRQVAEKVKNDEIELEKYVITKSLTKNPEEYSDAKNQPHVQVALRRKQNGFHDCNAGDTIPYIICETAINDNDGIASRAYHIEEIKSDKSKFKIDQVYYLSQQIHPVVSRLCENIEGTDSGTIAFCLGLDSSKYNRVAHKSYLAQDDSLLTSSSYLNSSERFKYCEPILLSCPECHFQFSLLDVNSFIENEKNFFSLPKSESSSSVDGKLAESISQEKNSGPVSSNKNASEPEEPQSEIKLEVTNPLQCPSCQHSNKCSIVTSTMLANQVKLQGERFISKYYEGWMKCDEATCDAISRNICLRLTPDHAEGATCPNFPRCSGQMIPLFTEADLYNQLSFFYRQLDGSVALDKIHDPNKRKEAEERLLPFQNSLKGALVVADSLRHKCCYRWVDLSQLFSPSF